MAKDKKETVKIKVLKPFRDKLDNKIRYVEGIELEFEAERAEDVISRGLAEYSEPVG
ncbi:hypothetical protein M2138_001721 [Dysgonomonadaceae bacterium PH5-43]|nr:hypothetical protein [Dysgonomonadaceae bacterium PH5-43]